MLTHSMTYAHPFPPMLFKLRPCIQKLCNVHYPPTPSLGWIRQIKGHSLSLASVRSASWLVYSLHLRSLTPIWSWMQGWTKPMPTHAHPWTIILHPCPPKTHGHGWAWVGMSMGMGISRGGHIPLCFVTTCDNGVFSGGVFMHLSIFPPPICRYKATLTYFLAPYIYL
jgi:hypothetical protein